MSSIADVSNRLGEYMLKGWVLTDQSCQTPGCNVPLMRSPANKSPTIHFCANCDTIPGEPGPQASARSPNSTSSSVASDSNPSRSSTPPTEVSSSLSSPVFAPPAETEESRRRRQQSDTASAEIGKRLLKGWAMLRDECPNECVICGGIYVVETDEIGRDRLVSTNASSSGSISLPTELIGAQSEHHPIIVHQGPLGAQAITAPNPIIPTGLANSLVRDAPHLQVLEDSASALQSTLYVLSSRLKLISDPNVAIDLASIGSTADTISKVTQALTHVRQLQWSESQARKL
ncbi:hypothetical protein H0H93_007740 [Arthromyces matolae]|nr:hypothetical protein H0H93_007740 [Arthromyces matolae]